MKDARPGESLWLEWHGQGYEPETEADIIYYTYDHVDLDNEVVRRALASSLQRDGIADSLSDGFKMVENGYIAIGWAGVLPGEVESWACDEDGITEYGDSVDSALQVTWIEL